MCGIVGMVAQEHVNQRLYDALLVLQHRGQDAAGIMTCDRGRFHLRKSNGLVRDVFDQAHMDRLAGNMGIGHVRYPTAGCSSTAEAQPFFVNSPYGIVLAHNGNLTNASQLHQELFQTDLRHINTTSDSEVLLNVFAHELQDVGKLRPEPEDIFEAVRRVYGRCRGAFAVVSIISGYGVVAFRDPCGIRPLVLGRRNTDLWGTEYMVASESVALVTQGFEVMRDIAPGEAVYITTQGQLHTKVCAPAPRQCPCIFEHVYLARPDSIVDGVYIYKARLRQGEKLAEKILREKPDHDIDVVMPIPDSGRTAAMAMAQRLDLPFREGFVKNRYIGRTFIMPGQAVRKKSVRQKLNPVDLEFKDKVVCLVDDSIVRGTTCQQIIRMARESGAKKVYFCSAAPPVRYPNVYGIDMPAAEELVAHGRTESEITRVIGADWLVYQDLDDLVAASAVGNPGLAEFDCSVFNGQYVTGDVDDAYFLRLSAERSDAAKHQREGWKAGVPIDMHNDG